MASQFQESNESHAQRKFATLICNNTCLHVEASGLTGCVSVYGNFGFRVEIGEGKIR